MFLFCLRSQCNCRRIALGSTSRTCCYVGLNYCPASGREQRNGEEKVHDPPPAVAERLGCSACTTTCVDRLGLHACFFLSPTQYPTPTPRSHV